MDEQFKYTGGGCVCLCWYADVKKFIHIAFITKLLLYFVTWHLYYVRYLAERGAAPTKLTGSLKASGGCMGCYAGLWPFVYIAFITTGAFMSPLAHTSVRYF